MYEASLSNDSAIFDYRAGFATIREALEWSLGRGPEYVIHISDGSYPDYHLCVHNNKLYYERGYCDWVEVSVDSFCNKKGENTL